MEAVISSSQKTPVLLGLEKDFFFLLKEIGSRFFQLFHGACTIKI